MREGEVMTLMSECVNLYRSIQRPVSLKKQAADAAQTEREETERVRQAELELARAQRALDAATAAQQAAAARREELESEVDTAEEEAEALVELAHRSLPGPLGHSEEPPPPADGDAEVGPDEQWRDLAAAASGQSSAGDVKAAQEIAQNMALLLTTSSELLGDLRMLVDPSSVATLMDETPAELIPPTADEIEAVIAYAEDHPNEFRLRSEDDPLRDEQAGDPLRDFPAELNKQVAGPILMLRYCALEGAGQAPLAHFDAGASGNDISDRLPAWQAIKLVMNRMARLLTARREPMHTLPRAASARIAVYNPNAHFRAESEHFRDEAPPLDDALRNCCLRDRPSGYDRGRRARTPLHVSVTDCAAFDVEGDLVALSGDSAKHSMREYRPWLGFMNVPVPQAPLTECQTLEDLKDAQGRELFDERASHTLSRAGRFGTVVADASANRVWAINSGSCSITGWDVERKQCLTKLAFPDSVRADAQGYARFFLGATRCGNTIVGAGGGSQLHIWDIPSAIEAHTRKDRKRSREETGAAAAATAAAEPASAEEDEAEGQQPAAEYFGCAPVASIGIEDATFSVGDCQRLSDTSVLVAASQGDVRDYLPHGSLRVVDLATQRVTQILAGHHEAPTIGRQLCAEIHNMVFSIGSNGTALVFDLRTSTPAFVLPKIKPPASALGGGSGLDALLQSLSAGNDNQILGVAFTVGDHS
jgi:hypothetical protein